MGWDRASRVTVEGGLFGAWTVQEPPGSCEEQRLRQDAMDDRPVRRVREEMERGEGRPVQPHYMEWFFHKAFVGLGRRARRRGAGRTPAWTRARGAGLGRVIRSST